VDNDDGSAYYYTHHKYFAYADTGMKNDFNGHDNVHKNNVYAYIKQGVGICGAFPGHQDSFIGNKIIQKRSGGYADYDCDCNATKSCPLFSDNQIFTPDGTIIAVKRLLVSLD
jgi:hypothetical protein